MGGEGYLLKFITTLKTPNTAEEFKQSTIGMATSSNQKN